MNQNHTIRSLLLMLFVLLQCIAPLAHAHINGDNEGQHIHFDSIDSSLLSDHHQQADTTQFFAEEHHSAVVCMPPEYRSGALPVDQPVVASKPGVIMPGEQGRIVLGGFLQPVFPPLPYQHPFSQAPPV